MSKLLNILRDSGVDLADLDRRRIARGEELIRAGDGSSEIYFVIAGRFRVHRDGQTLGYVDSGGVVGEVAFFAGLPRTASVVAQRDSLVLRLTRDSYESVCANNPEVIEAINVELAIRIHERNRTRDHLNDEWTRPRVIALIQSCPDEAFGPFVERLRSGLTRAPDVRVLTREDYDRQSGGAAIGSPECLEWFSRTESESGLCIYLPTERDETDWLSAIVRQSDQIVVVGEAGPVPDLSLGEALAFEHLAPHQRRLVLLHETRQPTVSGTGAWLRTRPVAMHHHVALTDDDDIRRFIRFITGRAVGLVLAGGGAFGVAHIGVHRALTDAGVTFDILGGASVGSAMSAAFALGITGEELVRRTRSMFIKHKALGRINFPLHSLMNHLPFDAQLRTNLTDVDIEDLWLPFYAVATDLHADQITAIRRGPLWAAVRASSAIPGVLPPYIDASDRLLVDGGVLDNLPYRTMNRIKSGPNVIVSLDRPLGTVADYSYDQIPGPGAIALDLLRPWRTRRSAAPAVSETIMRSVMAGRAIDLGDLEPDDWLLSPPLGKTKSIMDWKGAFDLLEPAEASTRAKIAELAESAPELWRALCAS